MSINIDFSKTFEFDVRVSSDLMGDIGNGKLQIAPERWPTIRLDNFQNLLRLDNEGKYDILKATITGSGEVFTLIGCSVNVNVIDVDFVVAGNISDCFQSFSVSFDGINDWFMPQRSLSEIIMPDTSASTIVDHIAVSVRSEQQAFNISTERVVNIQKNDEGYIVNECVLFNFKKINNFFSSVEVKDKVLELSTLLSVLVAIPLTVASLIVEGEKGKSYFSFFPTYKKNNDIERKRSWIEYFVRKDQIDNRWQSIFDNYYRSKYRDVIWVRLAGMQRYFGFWEYKALGYVSILDQYLSLNTKDMRRERKQERRVKSLCSQLEGIIPELTQDQKIKVFAVVQDSLSSSQKLTLKEQFEWLNASMDADISKIINFNDSDFKLIKSIRDAIAHGDIPAINGEDFNSVGVIVGKINLLLTYLAFKDLGLNDKDFLECLKSHSQLHMRAKIDKIHLSRITDSAGFFKISEEQFDELEKIERIKIQACFYKHKDGRIEYSEKKSDALRAWIKNQNSGQIPVDIIFEESKDKIKCWGEAYLETETRRLPIYMPYFIDYE